MNNFEQERELGNDDIKKQTKNISYNAKEKKNIEDVKISGDTVNNAEQNNKIKVMDFKDDLLKEVKEKEETKIKNIMNDDE